MIIGIPYGGDKSPPPRPMAGPQPFNQIGTLSEQLSRAKQSRRGVVVPWPEAVVRRMLLTLAEDPRYTRALRRVLFPPMKESP
jgi:hypothetical protein